MISFYDKELEKINNAILKTPAGDIPALLSTIPLGIYGLIEYGSLGKRFSNIRKYLPSMASEKVQTDWTGAHGTELLKQSVDFMKCLVHFYETFTMKKLSNANVLDFGCGWGRLTRLLLKYVPENQIYAVDPMDASLDVCKEHKVRANFGKTQYICNDLPFADIKYDLIFAFSVFTHLSEKACNAAIKTFHANAHPNTVLAITLRPREYWEYHHTHIGPIPLKDVLRTHDNIGYSFLPHGWATEEGDMTYGDTSITLEYIQREWKDWAIIGSDMTLSDIFQPVVFLRPVM